MPDNIIIKRTTTDDPDFILLIQQLDDELWNELNEDQATYDQYNKVPQIPTAIVVYANESPVASGCFKVMETATAEIKRMFVQKSHRGQGLSKTVLMELENWAREQNISILILETSIHFKVARTLYQHAGFNIIPNYGPYKDLEESVCMQKILLP